MMSKKLYCDFSVANLINFKLSLAKKHMKGNFVSSNLLNS